VVKAADDPEAKPAEGNACLKAGYIPSPNKIMAAPAQYTPAFAGWKPGSGKVLSVVSSAPASYFEIKQTGTRKLKNNQIYTFSMKVKGSKVTDAGVGIFLHGVKELSTAKLVRSDRNAVAKLENKAEEKKMEIFRFNVGPQWTEVKGEISVKFSNKDLAAAALDGKDGILEWSTTIIFNLSPGSGVLYVDDMKIFEK
jgi:hypothetical protein